jgi:hypothetical protein
MKGGRKEVKKEGREGRRNNEHQNAQYTIHDVQYID